MAGKDLILDFSEYDLDNVVADIDEIRRYNPQRFEMEQLSRIVFADPERQICVGYKDHGHDEFWRGHMPGMPLLPGVLMCEAAAQLCSFFALKYDMLGCKVVGFGGMEDVRFRDPVRPGDRLVIVTGLLKLRRRAMVVSHFQGFVRQTLVCEGKIKGVPLPTDLWRSSPPRPDNLDVLLRMIFPFRDNIPLRRRPIVTYSLIAINVAVFCAMFRMPPLEREWFEYRHGFVPARISQLSNHQALNVQLEISGLDPRLGFPMVFRQDRQLDAAPTEIFASLLTTMFLHAGWLHLVSNMWFLWLFGDNVEDRLGRLPFVCFYLAGGLLATMFHWWNNPASELPLVGASGAIAAVLGAYAVTWPAAGCARWCSSSSFSRSSSCRLCWSWVCGLRRSCSRLPMDSSWPRLGALPGGSILAGSWWRR